MRLIRTALLAAALFAALLATRRATAMPHLDSLTVGQVATTTPSVVQRYAYSLFQAGRVEEAYDLINAIPDAKLSSKQADLKATRVEFWGKQAAKAKEARALASKSGEALAADAAALSAMGKPSKWDAAFKVAAAGAIASAEDFDAARKCLTHFKYLIRTDKTQDYANSFLNQRLQALVVAVPAKTEWLYDGGQRWKEAVWAKAEAGDATYMDVLAAAASKGVMQGAYVDAFFLFNNARTPADFDAVTSKCQAILDSPGFLGGDAPKREIALYAALPRRVVTFEAIDLRVAERYGITPDRLKQHGRGVGEAKAVAVELACLLTGRNQREVGVWYGGVGSSAVSKIREGIRREKTRGEGTAYKMVQSLMGKSRL